MSDAVNWNTLRDKARAAMRGAYAPYSRFPVGAAALVAEGRIISGCNVENVSYGLGICAECSLAADLHRTGGGRLIAVSVTDARGQILMPCGRCRQILFEFGGADLLVDHPDGPKRLADLLPDAFGPDDIDAVTATVGA
ncbi:cytidine deaminase [Williamsia sp. CHRR-6]|uniref:cytidine deaminase n=1 Tax=Williamsia sp. CHRR-6 TaxID=2835871 RepID=UPI0027DBDAD8|nr:cytidine deaminase [Williamsia sp. CHRR-6]